MSKDPEEVNKLTESTYKVGFKQMSREQYFNRWGKKCCLEPRHVASHVATLRRFVLFYVVRCLESQSNSDR